MRALWTAGILPAMAGGSEKSLKSYINVYSRSARKLFDSPLHFFKRYIHRDTPRVLAMARIELRSYCFLDSMQPQFASFQATIAQGYLPVAGQAGLFIEVAPGMEIQRLLDVACKATAVMPGQLQVERAFGMCEIHHESVGEVRQAGAAILDAIGCKEKDRVKPRVTTSTLIRNVTAYHSMLINRTRHGAMLLAGQTLYILEVEPAAYIHLAANEAEKASHMTLLELRGVGAFGRLFLGGDEADVVIAAEAAEAALKADRGEG
jgi:hypothetical protein